MLSQSPKAPNVGIDSLNSTTKVPMKEIAASPVPAPITTTLPGDWRLTSVEKEKNFRSCTYCQHLGERGTEHTRTRRKKVRCSRSDRICGRYSRRDYKCRYQGRKRHRASQAGLPRELYEFQNQLGMAYFVPCKRRFSVFFVLTNQHPKRAQELKGISASSELRLSSVGSHLANWGVGNDNVMVLIRPSVYKFGSLESS